MKFRACLPLFALAISASCLAQTSTYTVLHHLSSSNKEGQGAATAPIQATDGNFYALTQGGGGTVASGVPSGTFVQITPAGAFSVLHTFDDENEGNGFISSLYEAADGSIYGAESCQVQSGSIFKYNVASASYAVVENFQTDESPVGTCPSTGLMQGPDGSLIGILNDDESSLNTDGGGQLMYKLNISTGKVTPFVHLPNHVSGSSVENQNPNLPVLASDGNLYGSLGVGGSTTFGYVYKVTPAGVLTVLHTFTSSEGETPTGPMVEAADGNLYGELLAGSNANNNLGAIYKVTLSTGAVSIAYQYPADQSDGNGPFNGLRIGSDGNIWGFNQETGPGEFGGNLFSLTTGGQYTVYQPAQTGSDPGGHEYLGAPTQGNDGSWYGGSVQGFNSNGAFFKFAVSPALTAPVQIGFSSPSIIHGQSSTLSWSATPFLQVPGSICAAFESSSAAGFTGGEPATGTLATSTLVPAGSYTYSLECGGAEYNGAALTITQQGSTTTVTPSAATLQTGVTLTLSAAIGRVLNAGLTPTGNVAFTFNGATQNLSSAAAAAQAMFSTTGLKPGTYSYSAVYAGDNNYTGSSSTTGTITIVADTTATTLTIAPQPISVGANVMLTANVSRTALTTNPGNAGSVTFYAFGSVALATVPVSNGVATLQANTSGYGPGTYQLTAKYSGDTFDLASMSSTVDATLSKAAPAVVLTAPATIKTGATGTLSAKVSRPAGSSGVPTGSVTFAVGTTVIATVGVNASTGVASLTTAAQVAPGTYPIHATYNGDANDNSAVSNTVNVAVTQ